MTTFFVGLDLGGSGTRAALADADGQVLAIGQGAAFGNLAGAAGRRQLARALDAALAPIAPLIAQRACAMYAGMTGLSVPGRRDSLAVALSARFPLASVRISNDALIALWGGLAGQEGVAVLAGTGSIALARGADGREARAGGWGYLLGDEGSGYWLGREAIAAYLRTLEARAPASAPGDLRTLEGHAPASVPGDLPTLTGRGAPSPLADLVAQALGQHAASVPRVIGWLNADQGQVRRLADLAPLVSRAALVGDPVAVAILSRAAKALADLATSAAHQLWGRSIPPALKVACCGGVWSAGPPLSIPFAAALAERLPSAVPGAPVLPPLAGALLLAMASTAPATPPNVLERLKPAFKVDSAGNWHSSGTGRRG